MERNGFHTELLGENVYVFSPQDDPVQVQAALDGLWRRQETNQFGQERCALCFLPGRYAPELRVKVGFYTQVCGLGLQPDDTVLPHVDCDARWLPHPAGNHNATCNFWRGAENLCVDGDMLWAVSQATFLRRVHIRGALTLHDEHGWASGGFLANAKVDGMTDSGTQQQWLSRSCDWQGWTGQNWNLVFAGLAPGKAPAGTWPETKFTTVPTVPRMREKPFLACGPDGGLGVCLPAARRDAAGFDWQTGHFLPLEKFYMAKPGADAAALNAALRAGRHLLLTPGIYDLDEPLILDRPGTVCLGLGLATLRSAAGRACLEVCGDAPVTVAGLLFDAGPKPTGCLCTVGTAAPRCAPQPDGFTLLADLFFRVGGACSYPTQVDTCLHIAQDGVVGDNFWIWRADHSHGVGWDVNRARTGLLVSGRGVHLYALMVEHFQQYQTVWEGEDGRTVFYQSEIPYDVPCQEVWRGRGGTVDGFASYKIGDAVASHEAWGLGIYLFNRDAAVELDHVMELPAAAQSIRIHNICSVMITGKPGIRHVINELGGTARKPGARAIVTEYPVGP